MNDKSPSILRLAAGETELIIDARVGERPRILHWGNPIPASDGEELRLLGFRQWVFGGPNRDLPPSLVNELGAGQPGPSGFLAHRDGRDWAALFRVVETKGPEAGALRILTRDENARIEIEHKFHLCTDSQVLTIDCEVRNIGDAPLSLDWVTSCAMPLDTQLERLRGFTGKWASEFQTEEVALRRGSYVRENRTGRTSHDNFPGLIALGSSTDEERGPCAGFHLAWSGNSRVRADLHSDGRAYVQMGELFLPGEMDLAPGQVYRTPQLLAAWSGSGLSALSQRFHRHLRGSVLDERTKDRPRPVHFNTWEAVYFDHDEQKLMDLADLAESVGAERFVLDDGWFGGRRSDRAGLGDWTVSKDVYPEGLTRLVDHVRSLGMEFGIWFEPEMVNPDSDLFRAHPDWVLSADGVEQIPSRNQLVLDLAKPAVADHLSKAIDAIVRAYRVDYIKWDMNRDLHHPGTDGGRASVHRQTRALYALFERLRKAHPELEIESCSSGGGRADFGVLSYTDRIWTSDNNDALERQHIQRGASHFFPLSILGSHVGPKRCHITGRQLDMSFRIATAMFGHMGMEVDLTEETQEDIETLRRGISLYKEHRGLIHGGDFHRLETQPEFNAVGVVATGKGEALFSVAKLTSHSTSHPARLRFVGLDPACRYRVRMVWPIGLVGITIPSILEKAGLQGEGSVFSGAALMEFGMELPITHPETCLIYHLAVVS